jgi:hypothetical protein
MAKNNSLLRLQGKLGELVFVQNRSGNHVRLKRGTYKPAPINDTLKANASRSAILNQMASPFYAALRNVTGRFRDGRAWARILSRFLASSSNDPIVLFSQLEMMNMHDSYPLSQVWSVPIASVKVTTTQLLVNMQTIAVPYFGIGKNTNVFRYHITGLFKSNNSNEWQQDGTHTDWMPYFGEPDSWDFRFNRPMGSGIYVLVLKLEAGYNNTAVETLELTRVVVHSAGVY